MSPLVLVQLASSPTLAAQTPELPAATVGAVSLGGGLAGGAGGFVMGATWAVSQCNLAGCTAAFFTGGVTGAVIGYPVGALLAGSTVAWQWGLDAPRAAIAGGLMAGLTFGMIPLLVDGGNGQWAGPMYLAGAAVVPASMGLASIDWGLTPSYSADGAGFTLHRSF